MRAPILVLTLLVLTACGTEPRRTSALSYAGRDGALVKGLLPGDARDILEHADQFEILSLRPRGTWIENDTTQYLPGLFHGHRILGRAAVPPERRRRLVEALYAGVNESPSLGAGCWEPRHGIRARRGDRTVELQICFKCIAVRATGLRVPETDKLVRRKRPTTRSPNPVFDAELRRLGLPKDGPWKD